jgi:hypothetical protein
MFGRHTDARTAGSTGGSRSTPAKKQAAIDREAARRAARKLAAVVVESASGTDVVVFHDWKKHCKNCAQSQN